ARRETVDAIGLRGDETVAVPRNLGLEQTDCLAAPGFAEVVEGETGTLSRVHRGVALHIGKSAVALAIAAVRGAEQGEERGVLRERQNLAVTECPTLR